VLVAEATGGEALGFVQLYPCFSSIRAAPVFILRDLFVGPSARGGGVGRRLMDAAARKLALDPAELRQHPLQVGLSMTATIDTRSK
jgi:GNAT superfamily N-acetyltransferase